MLSFQKLDVYRCAIAFLALSIEMPANLPRGHAALVDQLRRAARSVLLERVVSMLTKLARVQAG